MTIINGVDTNTIDYAALGRYMQPQMTPELGQYLASLPPSNLLQGPTGADLATWGNQRRALGDTWGNENANYASNRASDLAAQSHDTGQLAQTWDRTRTTLPGQFLHKGLMNSGVYGGALQQYGQNRASAEGNLQLKYQNMIGGLDQAHQNASNTYTSGMGQVDQTEQATRADLAAQLKGL
jgi:hypothetical protein